MILVVGLGNPGERYENTRHNLGFMLVDRLVDNSFSKPSLKCFGELYKSQNLLILKPTTYMNNSGESVKIVVDFYKPSRIIVCHDELNIDFGRLRIKKGGSAGGHNGLKSIDAHIGNDYERMRLGIGKPSEKNEIINFVLNKFSSDEMQKMPDFLEHCEKALKHLINNGLASTQSIFSR